MNSRIARSRRGVSLTELLLLMSSCMMILTMCTVLLQRVMRVQIESRSFVEAERTSERLSHHVRQDIHQANAIKVNDSKNNAGAILQLQLADSQSIEYGRAKGIITRVVTQSGKVVGREEFAFEPSCTLDVHESESPKRIVLSIMSPALESAPDKAAQLQSYRAVPVGVHIEASVGRDVAETNSNADQERAK